MTRSLAENSVGFTAADDPRALDAAVLARGSATRRSTALTRRASRPANQSRVELVALAVVYLVSIASLAGFATFSLHPELLIRAQVSAATYGRIMVLAPRAQIIIAFVALALFVVGRVRTRWLVSFAIIYIVSLGAELAGTTVGLPFGPYSYTDGLGWKWLGHVPALIPLSWYMMALPSYAIAAWRYPDGAHVIRRVALGSFILLSWDLALDPAMSLATKYWIWATDGVYYGMPMLNLVGWFATGAALMTVFAALRSEAWVRELSAPWLVGFYGANLVLPLGMCLAAGLWGAVAATAAALALAWVIARPGSRKEVHP